MTREEKIKGLYSLKEYLVKNPIKLEGHKSLPITLIDYAIEALEREPKTGYWIGTRRVGCGFGEYKEYIVPIKDGIVTDSCHCSECGEWLTGSDEYECYGNYCPNCGAKMVEPQESEDK